MQRSDLAHVLRWDDRGLLPAVVQDARTGALLMLAWMNREALERTLDTGTAHFFSRSRQALWKKGETSGNTLAVRELRYDCDADAIAVVAEPAGPTCHTGKPSCFHHLVTLPGPGGASAGAPGGASAGAGSTRAARPVREDDGDVREDDGPSGPPAAVAARLEAILRDRRDNATSAGSYTRSLLDGGAARIGAKIAEEQAELVAELPAGTDDAVVHEAADLLYHVMVGLVSRDIPLDRVWAELARRFGVSGHDEKASR